MPPSRPLAVVALLLAVPALRADGSALPPPVARRVDFLTDVRPVLARSCFACHGPDKQRGGLRLDVRAAALMGGDSGPVIRIGQSAESRLIRYVAGLAADKVMPPKGERLSAEQVGLLRAWIDQGASWPDAAAGEAGTAEVWWSLRPLTRPAVPGIPNLKSQISNPIDAFVLAKLQAAGLEPSPEADRRTLLRRVTFDLTGLPPAPEEVEAWLSDTSPGAYERLVDRLLASPAYGERWARHWLDVVHYGDTHGYDKDKPRPNAWPYRDYVIRSLNADKPYARFVQEQLAGDVLFPGTADGIEALGFIAAGPWDFIGHAEVPETKTDGRIARHLDRDDMVANTVNTFVSLTVQCAQCHNHKFDPIPQEDYYRLQAVFAALDRADRPYYTDLAVARRAAELQARRRERRDRLKPLAARVVARGLAEQPVDADTRRALAAAVADLTAAEAAFKRLPPPHVVYCGTVHTGQGAFRGTGPDGGRPRPIHVLTRGDVKRPGPEVGPGALRAVAGLPHVFDLPPGHPEGARRAALARWLTDPANPLTWRSIVNRVWQYHFGRGIVETANDFGHMGRLPTHPELLDWLACEFRDGGQSLKRLHRLIVCSATYRQASAGHPEFEKLDAANVYLWRMNRRRLEAEAVRDCVLAVAGRLDRRMGGPAFQDFVIEKPEHSPHYEYQRFDADDPRGQRRSVYRVLVCSQQQPFMTVLDCADPSMQVDRRSETLSALQALALLNDDLMLVMARHFAERVERQGGDVGEQVAAAFRLALGREPAEGERAALAVYARRHGLANACRVILNLNEFVFID
jgi:cytochrome c553